jgi:CheY-like chemotaxis protein
MMIKKKILIVDDEAIVRKVLKACLGKMGHEVTEAVDGAQAMEQVRRNRFDLIICDVMMPRKDGWQVLSELKGNEETVDIPVILLTAKNQDEDMFKGYELHADYYMTKPFTQTQVIYGVKLMLAQDPLRS